MSISISKAKAMLHLQNSAVIFNHRWVFSVIHTNVVPNHAERGFGVCGGRSKENECSGPGVILRMECCACIISQAGPDNGQAEYGKI